MRGGLNRHGVERNAIRPDLATATKIDPGGMEVAVPVKSGNNTTFVVDATKANTLSYLLPFVDPAGAVIDGSPFTWPRLYIKAVTAPTDSVSFMTGLSDDAILTQYLVAGMWFDTVNPKTRLDAQGATGPADGAAVVGGNTSDFDAMAGASATTVDATFVQIGRAICLVDGVAGTGTGQILAPNDQWAGVPHYLVQIVSPGTSLNASMTIVAEHNYRAQFKQSAIGA